MNFSSCNASDSQSVIIRRHEHSLNEPDPKDQDEGKKKRKPGVNDVESPPKKIKAIDPNKHRQHVFTAEQPVYEKWKNYLNRRFLYLGELKNLDRDKYKTRAQDPELVPVRFLSLMMSFLSLNMIDQFTCALFSKWKEFDISRYEPPEASQKGILFMKLSEIFKNPKPIFDSEVEKQGDGQTRFSLFLRSSIIDPRLSTGCEDPKPSVFQAVWSPDFSSVKFFAGSPESVVPVLLLFCSKEFNEGSSSHDISHALYLIKYFWDVQFFLELGMTYSFDDWAANNFNDYCSFYELAKLC